MWLECILISVTIKTTSIINDKQYNRIQGYLENARDQGARIIEINPQNEILDDVRKIAPTLVTGVTTAMDIMQNEILVLFYQF